MNTTPCLLASLALWGAPEVSDQDADGAAFDGRRGGITYYDFDDDSVEGEILSPEGANVSARARVRHGSLINIRPHFLQELYWLSLDAP